MNFVFTKGATVYGPSQVEAAVNQDPKVSEQLTLWEQGGRTAIMGNLLVVPIANALLYVQPLYLQSTGGREGAADEAGDRLLPGEHVGRRDA